MGALQKYDNETLLKAVTLYAEVDKRMIKATELAKWASTNVSGLEGVQAYHFLRKVREKDPKTGKTIEVLRPCTKKINELNAIRNVAAVIEENPLINSSSLDAFFKYPRDEQRQMIINTRMQIEKLKAHNQYLSKENLRYRNENDSLHEKEETLLNMLEQIKSEQEHLSSVLKVMTTYIDERTRKDALATAGITNGDFDFKKYQENMSVSIEKVFSVSRIVGKQRTEHMSEPAQNMTDLINTGMDWDDDET